MSGATAASELTSLDLLRLLAGDRTMRKRLEAGEHMRALTPLAYPGRFGPIAVELALIPGGDGGPVVRISDGGGLIRSLDEQGMDLAVDDILSKTVFHAVREVEGANIAGGVVFIDSQMDKVPSDCWRFLQLINEICGLRHSKYKDALVRLSRRQEGPELTGWGRR